MMVLPLVSILRAQAATECNASSTHFLFEDMRFHVEFGIEDDDFGRVVGQKLVF